MTVFSDWFHSSEWRELNWFLVGFGQQICLPIGPKCSTCLNKDICPASSTKVPKVTEQEQPTESKKWLHRSSWTSFWPLINVALLGIITNFCSIQHHLARLIMFSIYCLSYCSV